MPLPIRQLLGFITYYASFSYYLLLLPIFDPWETDERFRQRLKKAARTSMRMFGVTIQLKGTENLNTGNNKIIIANHSSWFDQIALIASLDVPLSFVSNEKYFRYWGLNRVLRKMGSVPVQGRDITKSLKACRETLDAHNWLVIYPEGTRSSSLLPFRRGAALLAQQTGVPLQPILIDGAQEVLPRRTSLLKVQPGEMTLTILPSMPKPNTISTKVYMQQIQSCFTDQVSKPKLLRGTQTQEQQKIVPKATEAAAEVRHPPVTAPRTEASQAAAITSNSEPEATGINGPRQHYKDGTTDTTAEKGKQPQYPVDINTLQPSNWLGTFYLFYAIMMTVGSISLSLSSNLWFWLTGQFLLAITFIQWFAILHEAGHKTMFRTRWLNRLACYLAGFFALIPGDCWRLVHAKHHYWTGWQDLDVTTETLVPRQLRGFDRTTINTCWRLWIPLFASLYRWNNYWNLKRLRQMFQRPRQKRLVTVNILVYLLLYITFTIAAGVPTLLTAVGLGLLVSFALQDLLILSQHTHIPMQLSEGQAVRPFTPAQQEVYTRSLLFPTWFARLVLLNVDAHGLHHMLPRIPGYHLHQLQTRETMNCIRWWKWILAAKSVPGEILLFQNRDQTGFHF